MTLSEADTYPPNATNHKRSSNTIKLPAVCRLIAGAAQSGQLCVLLYVASVRQGTGGVLTEGTKKQKIELEFQAPRLFRSHTLREVCLSLVVALHYAVSFDAPCVVWKSDPSACDRYPAPQVHSCSGCVRPPDSTCFAVPLNIYTTRYVCAISCSRIPPRLPGAG